MNANKTINTVAGFDTNDLSSAAASVEAKSEVQEFVWFKVDEFSTDSFSAILDIVVDFL